MRRSSAKLLTLLTLGAMSACGGAGSEPSASGGPGGPCLACISAPQEPDPFDPDPAAGGFFSTELSVPVAASLDEIEITNSGEFPILSPRLLFNGSADLFAMSEYIDDVTRDADSDEAAAIALFADFGQRVGHYCSAGHGPHSERTSLGLLVQQGRGCCDDVSPGLANLFSGFGLPVRIVRRPNHVIPEVFYDDAWHMFDPDHDVFYRNNEGAVASSFDIAAEPQILDHDPAGFDVDFMRATYQDAPDVRDSGHLGRHKLHYGFDFSLHPNESVLLRRQPGTLTQPSYRDVPGVPPQGAFVEGQLNQVISRDQPSRFVTDGFAVRDGRLCVASPDVPATATVYIDFPYFLQTGQVDLRVESDEPVTVRAHVGEDTGLQVDGREGEPGEYELDLTSLLTLN